MIDVIDQPIVLFACRQGAGSSQIAASLMRAKYGHRINAWSGGTEPAAAVNPVAIAVASQAGIDISSEWPCSINDDDLNRASVVVTLSNGLALARFDGVRHEHWEIAPSRLQDSVAARTLVDDLLPRIDQLAAAL